MDLKGRGVFLTGGAQGLGKSFTIALLEKKAKVQFCDINAEVGKATEAELQKQYGADSVSFVQCDVTNAQQLQEAFDSAIKKFGAVEICANNAGILDERIWEKMLDINVTAQIRGSEIALEHMRRDKGGRGGVIINTASLAGWLRMSCVSPVYAASKSAMITFTTTQAVGRDMPAMGVRWCCLCPNSTNTAILDLGGGKCQREKEFLAFMERSSLMEPEMVARAFIQQLEDMDNNGKVMLVDRERGAVYRRRFVVDDDGVSNPLDVDEPLTSHPPVPGHNL